MNKLHKPVVSLAVSMVLLSGVSACSTIDRVKSAISDDNTINYQNNQAIKLLEVPPDLTTPEFDNSFDLPTGVVSAVSLKNGTRSTVYSSNRSRSNLGVVRRGDLSSVRTVSGKNVLQINDTYPRSLILTEIVLNRIGFVTTSKSPRGDVITTKYNGRDVLIKNKPTGFLGKIKSLVQSGSDNKALTNGQSYKFSIRNTQNAPIVSVSPVSAVPMSNEAHAKVIDMLNKAFNR